MSEAHSFHIPVLGIGYSADTPLKISRYGIDSVVSLVDDILLEKLRKMHCGRNAMIYHEISDKTNDFRAKRITAYLNMLKILSEKKFEDLKRSASRDTAVLNELIMMQPPGSSLEEYIKALPPSGNKPEAIKALLDEHLSMGSIDVNIMTKIDKDNYQQGEKLPIEFNDAHAAVRGFAESDVEASLVLSAGINPRLYTYMQHFEGFYPDESGYIKKKIVLKVSDYKSAMIQGKFLAKKGLWVSEYRIESGLNCGGHAFATDGFLMGPILAEFRDRRSELIQSVYDVLTPALSGKGRIVPDNGLPIKITAQGGVGTAKEHQFLIDHYNVDSVGWGTPFMLVPEATTVDDATLEKLIKAKEEDLYLSDISPLGIPFNSLRGNTKDLEKLSQIAEGKPGFSCSKKYAALSNEFSDKTICTASRRYQTLKLKELSKAGVSGEEYRGKYEKIVSKSCICVGLGTSCLLVNKLDHKTEGEGVSVCPGPNMAYFSNAMSLHDIINHIYGRSNMIKRKDRPNMFVKELDIYLNYLKQKITEETDLSDTKKRNHYIGFSKNLLEGIKYYENLFTETDNPFESTESEVLKTLNTFKNDLQRMLIKLEKKSELQVAH